EVIAVDAVPAMLRLLLDAARRDGTRNITTCRAPFRALPLGEGDVDVAVACSSFTKHGPHGGGTALLEAERVVRPGGLIAVIWPEDPAWFRRHGFRHLRLDADAVHHFRDVGTAERLCATYYSDDAAAWVRKRGSADVPYAVLGSEPPHDLCLKRIE
ncbi:MAG: class I SAM-dependent methyltransferase, partial [Candidatus Dormibacteria bacterium]